MGKRKVTLFMAAILTMTSVYPSGVAFAEDAIATESVIEGAADEVSSDTDIAGSAIMDDLDAEVDVVVDDSTEEVVSGTENTEELATEHEGESNLIEEIEIVETTAISTIANTEGTLQPGVSEIITFHNTNEERTYTYTPEEDGFYSLMVENISADNDDFEIGLGFSDLFGSGSLTTSMYESHPEIFFLQSGENYEFRLSAYSANEQNPVTFKFTFKKIPSIESIEPVNGPILEFVKKVHKRYYYDEVGVEDFLKTIKLRVNYSDGAASQIVPLLGQDSYGYCFTISDEDQDNPLWDGSDWENIFQDSYEGYQIPITYECATPIASDEARTTVTLRGKTLQDAVKGQTISVDAPLRVENATYGACAAFTAKEDGNYMFTCVSGEGMLIFNQNNKCIASSSYYGDDEETDSGLESILLQLSSGETYYVAVPAPGEDGTVNVAVRSNQINSMKVTSETGESWNIPDVCKKMKQIVLEIKYADGQTEVIRDWDWEVDEEDDEEGPSYIFSGTELQDSVRLYLVNKSGNKMNFLSHPVPAGSYHIKVLVNETEVELLNAPVITVEENYSDAQAVSLGDSIALNIPVGECGTFSFKPEQEGYYTLYVRNNVGESSDYRDYDRPGVFWFENGVLQEQYCQGNFNTCSRFFKSDTVYYFLIIGSLTDPITNSTLQIFPTGTVIGAEVVTPLNKVVYRKGVDNEIPIADMEVKLAYQSGDPQVLSYYDNTDIYGNRLYFALCKDKSGTPDYDSEVDYDPDDYDEGSVIDNLDIGTYWLCIDVLKVQGDAISIPPIQITVTDQESVPQPTPQPTVPETSAPSVDSPKNEVPVVEPKLKVPANSVKMQSNQTTTAFWVEMSKGDSIVSVESSNKKLLKISKINKTKGTFKMKAGKKTGKVKITIKLASGQSKVITLTVQKKKVTTKKVKVTKKLTLKKGEKYTLKPVITPITTQDKVKFKSSNKKIATVTGKGVVEAKNPGTVTLTVTCGKKKAKCKITVKK